MVFINTTDDLLRAARENKEFREAFRREILTEELIDSPEDLKELNAITRNLAATGGALLEHANATNQRLDKIGDGIDALVKGMADYRTATDASLKQIDGMVREQEQAQDSFRGDHAQRAANMDDLEIAVEFADLHGLNKNRLKTRHISRSVLEKWVDDNEDLLLSLNLRQDGALRKFERPDIIAVVFYTPANQRVPACYIAVEASYSGEEKDIDKATDNAKILRAITGLEAYPVVAAVRLHRLMSDAARGRLHEDVDDYLAAGDTDAAFWYKLDSADLRPPHPR